ncbi:TlpA family protein disulfide reductase [Stackebrandtia soli]|uniref:TlpA family protein disulfide reductase n=1 Tax=Stackebrandtia soli TaxID=1892856 RepID=UPI0039EA0567
MIFLTIAVVLLALLCLANLLLIFAVFRRLREHTAELSRLSRGAPQPFRDELVGQSVPTFEASAIDGTAVTGAGLVGRPGLVGFFSAGCEPCHDQAPKFAKWSSVGGGGAATIAVVTGDGPQAEELVEAFRDRATVVAEPDASVVASAFGIEAFPTFLRIDAEGTITDTGVEVRDVVALAAELTRH